MIHYVNCSNFKNLLKYLIYLHINIFSTCEPYLIDIHHYSSNSYHRLLALMEMHRALRPFFWIQDSNFQVHLLTLPSLLHIYWMPCYYKGKHTIFQKLMFRLLFHHLLGHTILLIWDITFLGPFLLSTLYKSLPKKSFMAIRYE